MAAAPDSNGAQTKRNSVGSVGVTNGAQSKRSSVGSTRAVPTFPEGGLQAWATIAGACVTNILRYTTSFGVYEDFYKRDFLTTSSASSISWIGSLSTFFVISGGLLSGRLFDRGYFYHLMIGGSLLLSFSLFMLSLCKPEKYYQVFLAHGVGVGLGAGTTYVPSIAIVSHYFRRRRAIAMAIVSTGSSLGAVVHPIMLNNTLRSHLGFGNAVRASAGLVSGLLLIACLLMRPRLPPPAADPPLWKSLKRFSRDRVYLTAIAGMTTFIGGFYFPIFYLQLDAISHGVSQTLGFYSLVILNGASCVGRLWPGFFAQRLGVINILMAASGCGAVLILSMIALKSVASVVAIGIIYGFWAGVFVTLMAPLVAVLTENMEELGLRMGVAFGIAGFSALICASLLAYMNVFLTLSMYRPAYRRHTAHGALHVVAARGVQRGVGVRRVQLLRFDGHWFTEASCGEDQTSGDSCDTSGDDGSRCVRAAPGDR
ncbi:major facilitator superfamily domain-containing protein [Mycena pura]|uniref:Major facilitator superfamily domain-containing protein n=1 Tax=Mycena pura TaxID=153505 RepID=A0AAD6Y6G2_9AGAR|nr:major facilitator superfamily domain-containing protein [Mycena pura]